MRSADLYLLRIQVAMPDQNAICLVHAIVMSYVHKLLISLRLKTKIFRTMHVSAI